MKKFLAVLAAGIVICGMYLFSPYRRQEQITVPLIYPEHQDIRDTVLLQGEVVDPSPVYLYAQTNSIVNEICISVGERVTAGQVLMSLTPTSDHVDVKLDPGMLSDFAETFSPNTGAVLSAVLQQMSMQTEGKNTEPQTTGYQLCSTVDGIIMDLYAVCGESVSTFIPCVVICDTESLILQAKADEASIGQLRESMNCEISIPAFGQNYLSGMITAIDPYAKQNFLNFGTETAKTTVSISVQEKEALLPGYRAEIRVITNQKKDALLVPYEAVQQDEADNEYVLVIRDGVVCKQIVLTGSELSTQVAIIWGITAGDLLIAQPSPEMEGKQIQYA